jgi:hypothetical protein
MTSVLWCLLLVLQGYSGPAALDLSHWLVRELDQQQKPAAMPSELACCILCCLLSVDVCRCSRSVVTDGPTAAACSHAQ